MEKTDSMNIIVGLFLLPNNDMLLGEVDTTEVTEEYNIRNPIIMRTIQALVPMQSPLAGKAELVPVVNTAFIRIPVTVLTLIDYLGVSFVGEDSATYNDYFKFLDGLREREKQLQGKVSSIH